MNRRRLVLRWVEALAVASTAVFLSCQANQPSNVHVLTDTLWDTDYQRHTFYRLPSDSYSINKLRVYIDNGNPNDNTRSQHCLATVLPTRPGDSTGYVYVADRYVGWFDLKSPNVDYLTSADLSYIEFAPNAVTPVSAIAISFTTADGETVGGNRWFDPARGESLLVLRLLKPRTAAPSSLTWNSEMKNTYKIGGPGFNNIKLKSVSAIRHFHDQESTVDENGVRFLHLVGFDPDDDGVVKWPQSNSYQGCLISTEQFPFISESLTVPDSIYQLVSPESYLAPKYKLVIKYSKPDTT